MNDTQLMIWFLATAVMVTAVLTIGTLAAADLLPRRRPGSTSPTSGDTGPSLPATRPRTGDGRVDGLRRGS